jgi:uncharacterized membrane protein
LSRGGRELDLVSDIAGMLGSLPPELVVVVLAMVPIFELRGALPVAMLLYEMDIAPALALSIFGNIIPVPVLLLFLEPVSKWLRRWKTWDRFFTWLFGRTRRDYSGRIERYKTLALTLFVAIPLPVTGAWTGSAAAFVFGFRFRSALLAISAGIVLASAIVSGLILLGTMSLGG